jgi:hypothetical protein
VSEDDVRTGDTMQEIASSERNATVCIPLFGLEEIASVREKHLFDTGSEDDRTHRALKTY